jgi:hypothetical protein
VCHDRPDDGAGAVDVALCVGHTDHFEIVAAKAAHQVEQPVAEDRRRDGIHRQPIALPDDVAGGQVVAAHAFHRRDHDLRASVDFDDERRGPGVDLFARHTPQLFAVTFVQRHHE